MIEHAKPCGVAIAILDDVVRLLNALELEAVGQRGAARWFVERVALPFGAAVAEGEDVREQQPRGFARGAGALRAGGVPDAAELKY